jgi:hypothetical protein
MWKGINFETAQHVTPGYWNQLTSPLNWVNLNVLVRQFRYYKSGLKRYFTKLKNSFFIAFPLEFGQKMVVNWDVTWSDFSDCKGCILKAYRYTYKYCGGVLMTLSWHQPNEYVPKWTNENVVYTTQVFSKKRVNTYMPISFCSFVFTINYSIHVFLARCQWNWAIWSPKYSNCIYYMHNKHFIQNIHFILSL